MKDAKGHGSDARNGGAEKPTPNRAARSFAVKKRKLNRFSGGGGSSGGGGGGGSGGGGGGGSMQKHKQGAHTASIHKAANMNLAQLSAAGTNPAIPAPVIGGRK